jgi:hypothetical protein
VKNKKQKKHAQRQQNLHRRLAHKNFTASKKPLLGQLPIHYRLSERTRVLAYGGLGAIHTLITKLKLPQTINDHVQVFSRHLPYFESDHILSLCYNMLTGGKTLEEVNRLRRDEAYLDALAVRRVPAPSTAGDFLRRFDEAAILKLQQAINTVRLKVWKKQPRGFRKRATIDVDGTIIQTDAECKEGIDYCAYKRQWGYAPLLVSLAQTREPLFVVNRPGSAVSHLGAAPWIDRALDLVSRVFDEIWLRGDTDFSLTEHFDKWHRRGVKFIFGYDAMPNLVKIAEALPEAAWSLFERPPAYAVKTKTRRKPKRVKQQIVHERGYKKITLVQEDLAEFAYKPGKCRKAYRMLVLRKTEHITRGGQLVEERERYLFYITNEEETTAEAMVLFIDGRCDQENTIEQLKNGVPAFNAPCDTLQANWVAMVIGALAWSLKAWYGLLIEEPRLRHQVVRMEFKQFLERFICLPCQVVRQGRRLLYQIVHFSVDTLTFLRLYQRLKQLDFP